MCPLPSTPYHYIDSGASLAPLVAAIEASGRAAVDIEADSLHHYREKVCLIQVTAGGQDFIVDPLARFDMTRLLDALAARQIILHGADYDLRMLKGSFGFVPRGGVFDTMLAAQLLGYAQIGLAALAMRFFGVTLSKRGQKSDWSRRPLEPQQLEYARCDTHYLEQLSDILRQELGPRGREGWHREACAAAVEAAIVAVPQQDREDPEAWRVRGAGFCSRRELAFLRELWRWREGQAREADRPRFKILGDEPLLHLARWAAARRGDAWAGAPRLPRDFRGRRLASLQGVLGRARGMPEASWPGPLRPERRRHRAPDCSADIEKLRHSCAQLAHGLRIAPSVIAPRASITAIAQRFGSPLPGGDPGEQCSFIEEVMAAGGLMRWQAELLLPSVQEIVARRLPVTALPPSPRSSPHRRRR